MPTDDKPQSLLPEGTPSPLAEAESSSIDLLFSDEKKLSQIFNTKPSELTDLEIDTVVAYYRAQRERFIKEDFIKSQQPPKGAGGAKPTSVREALKASLAASQLDL